MEASSWEEAFENRTGICPGVVRLESDYIKSLQLTHMDMYTYDITYACICKIYFKAIYDRYHKRGSECYK